MMEVKLATIKPRVGQITWAVDSNVRPLQPTTDVWGILANGDSVIILEDFRIPRFGLLLE
jgi:hypothetical protein